MNYESMIDSLNDDMQYTFFENALEVINLNEEFNIGDKIEAIKTAVINFFKTIAEKMRNFINWVKKKIKGDKDDKKEVEEVARAISASPEKMVDLGDQHIKFNQIHKNRVTMLLTLQDQGIEDVEKIARIAADTGNGAADRLEAARDMHESYLKKVESMGITTKDNKESIYSSLFTSSELGKVTAATVKSFGSEITYAQSLIDSANEKAKKFDQACTKAKSAIASIKPTKRKNGTGVPSSSMRGGSNQTARLKKVCSTLVAETRVTYSVITTAFRTLTRHKVQMSALIARVKAKLNPRSVKGNTREVE